MKHFDRPKTPPHKSPISRISINGDYLVVVLVSEEHRDMMDKYLNALLTEFRIEDRIKNAFTFEYDNNSFSYKINPINAKTKDILENFAAANLLPSKNKNENPSPRY